MQKSHFRLTLKSPLGAVILLTVKLSQVSSLKLGQITHGPLHVIHVYTSEYYSRYFQTYAKKNVLRAAPLHERCATLLSSLRHWIAPTFEFPAEWQFNTKQPVFFFGKWWENPWDEGPSTIKPINTPYLSRYLLRTIPLYYWMEMVS